MEIAELYDKSYADLEFTEFRRRLAGYARSAHGKRLALESPVNFALKDIEIALSETGEAVKFIETRPEFEGIEFEKVGDVEGLIKKTSIGDSLLKDDLKVLREFLEACGSADDFRKRLKPDKEKRLLDILYPWESLGILYGRYRSIFTPEGEVRDSASPALRKLRSQVAAQEHVIKKTVDSLV